jgi:hypothetical protein
LRFGDRAAVLSKACDQSRNCYLQAANFAQNTIWEGVCDLLLVHNLSDTLTPRSKAGLDKPLTFMAEPRIACKHLANRRHSIRLVGAFYG